jgi:hypothetical protein
MIPTGRLQGFRISVAWRRILGWAVVLAAPAIQFWHLRRYAVDVFIWDEWDLVPFLRTVHEGGNWWPWVFRQHNEHRVAAMRLSLAWIAERWHWSVVPEMYFGFLLQILAVAGLWRLFSRVTARDPWRFAPVAFVCFGLIHYTLFLYGMMFVWNLLLAATIWALWLLARQDWAGFVGAAALGIVASFTINNGLLVWPIGLFLLWLGRDHKVRLIAWSAVGLVVFIFYYRGYVHPGHHPPLAAALGEPIQSGKFFVKLIGAPFGGGSGPWSFVMGAAVLAFLLASCWGSWRRWRERREDRVMLCLLLFAAVSAAAVTVSRVVLSPGFALEPRYASFTLLIPIAALFAWLAEPRFSLRRQAAVWAAAAVLLLGFARGTAAARANIAEWSRQRERQAALLFSGKTLSDAEVATFHPSIANVRSGIAYMRAHRLSVFAPGAEPARKAQLGGSLMLQGWKEGRPLDEITSEREVRQRFVCPVDILADLAVPFATYGRHNEGNLILRLTSGDAELGRRRVPMSAIADNGWVSLQIEPPITACRGRELTLILTSEGTRPGRSVTAWTYPAYYEGSLVQSNGPDRPGYCLGLELNRAN